MESTGTSSSAKIDISQSMSSRLEGLIEVPITKQASDALIAMFNYFDNYAPKTPGFYEVVTYLRFFQLLGAAMMAPNRRIFQEGTLTYSAMSILSIAYHVIPVEVRFGNEDTIALIINCILIAFGAYLIVTAMIYHKTTNLPKLSMYILNFFMVFGPFYFIPVSAQFTGQLVSAYIMKELKVTPIGIVAIISTIAALGLYFWALVASFALTLVFRPSSFFAADGMAQIKLMGCTTAVTFFTALTTYTSKNATAVLSVLTIFIYAYACSTCFNCSTYVKFTHLCMVMGGSLLSMIVLLANLYPILSGKPWGPIYFILYLCCGIVVFILTYVFMRLLEKKELAKLDMFDETKDIKIFGSMRKIRRATGTGFTYCHPACLSFSIFKASIDEWPDQLSPWSSYAKFISIYPEHTDQLMYIVQNIANIKANKMYRDIIVSNIATIIQTRETNYTPRIKSKISKFQKVINKAKNRIRNIWDLILQNNLLEMNKSIKSAMETIKECEVDINNMMMLHSNNRFVARQYAKYCLEIHADGAEFKEWSENIRKLQMGQKVKPDVIHDLAMSIFPNIPAHSLNKEDMKYSVTDEMEGEAVDEPIEDNPDIELIDVLNNQVKKHKVPAIVFMYWSTIAMFVIIVAIPIIAIMIYFPKYIIDLQEPLTFLNGISYLRNLINVMSSMSGKYILEEMYDERTGDKIMQKNQLEPGFPMTAFGGYKDTNLIMYYLASQVSYANELMSKIRSYKPGNSFIEKARSTLFTSNLNFSYFLAYNNTVIFNASTDQIAIMVSLHVGKLAEIGQMSPDIARGTDALTCRNNNIVPTTAMSNALDIVNEYIISINARDKKIFISLMVLLIIICCLGYLILFNVQIKKLRKNNMDIMGIFSTIPKTVISTVSASFNHVKKNDTSNADQTEQQRREDEMSRQEESIMKLFSTISDGTSQATNAQKNQFCFFIIAVCASIGYYLTIIRFLNASNTMKLSCHHIDYLYGSNTYLYAVMGRIFKIILQEYNEEVFWGTIVNLEDEIKYIGIYIPKQIDYFHKILLGYPAAGEVPFIGMTETLNDASKLTACTDKLEPPETVPHSAHCFQIASQVYLTTALLKKIYSNLNVAPDKRIYPTPREDGIDTLWQIGPIELYEAFFYRAGNRLVKMIQDDINKQSKQVTYLGIIFIIIPLIFTIIALYINKTEDDMLRFTLHLLLFCPPKIIVSNKKIMDMLAGDYSNKDGDQSAKHLAYSNDVMNKLNDCIIVIQDDDSHKVVQVNTALEETFGVKSADLIGKTVMDFFNPNRFEVRGKLENVVTQITDTKFEKDGNTVFMEWTPVIVSGTKILSGRDKTQNILHEMLIDEEKKKSDTMLASILPASLVPRVQAGEKNISFSVQSVTVLFFDVVEFTPWCGSHDAQYVMRMLNIVFKEMDAITNAHKTMTKIKCIGDCYMAAGGIFDEVNQPQVHAREVVDFGCLAINKLLEIDQRENETLRIRVGINTGGPIVAGVIGTEKPTFEILGPAINIAHEMEHHGVPMQVHISRPVYEFIYGAQFQIKERGEIEVKGGKMFTYLVDPNSVLNMTPQ